MLRRGREWREGRKEGKSFPCIWKLKKPTRKGDGGLM